MDKGIYSNFRLEATLNCGLRLEKFPFDVQECPLVFESCTLPLLEIKVSYPFFLYVYYCR
jgi:hypothetical protein